MSDSDAFHRGLPWPLRLLLAGACVVVIIAGLRAIAPILSSFLIGLLLAMVLAPVMLWLMRRGVPRGLSLLMVLALVFCVGGFVIYLLAGSLSELRGKIPQYGEKLTELRSQAIEVLARFDVDPSAVGEILQPGKAVGPVAHAVGSLLSELGHSIFILLITAFLLIEVTILVRKVHEEGRSPRSPLVRFVEMSEDVQKFMGINALVGFIGCVLYAILLKAMHVPFVPTWVVLYFFLGFIPAIGGVIAVIPVLLLIILDQSLKSAIIFMAIFVVMNFINGDLIKPRILKGGFEISIVSVFFSLVFWNYVLGPVGVVLAVPLTITLKKLFQEFAPELRSAVLG